MESIATNEGVALSGDVILDNIEILVESLKDTLATAHEIIRIDMEKVKALDVAALQVFIAAAKSADQQQKQIKLVSLSDPVLHTLELTGLEAMFKES